MPNPVARIERRLRSRRAREGRSVSRRLTEYATARLMGPAGACQCTVFPGSGRPGHSLPPSDSLLIQPAVKVTRIPGGDSSWRVRAHGPQGLSLAS